MTTRLRVDLDASQVAPTPGTYYVVVHVDHRNRQADLQPASELGGPVGLSGWHTMTGDQVFHFVSDEHVTAVHPSGEGVFAHGRPHQVVGRHDYTEAR